MRVVEVGARSDSVPWAGGELQAGERRGRRRREVDHVEVLATCREVDGRLALPVAEHPELGQLHLGGDPDRLQAGVPLVPDVAHRVSNLAASNVVESASSAESSAAAAAGSYNKHRKQKEKFAALTSKGWPSARSSGLWLRGPAFPSVVEVASRPGRVPGGVALTRKGIFVRQAAR